MTVHDIARRCRLIGGIMAVAACAMLTVTAVSAQQGTTVNATEADFTITLAQSSVPAGPVTFSVNNTSPTTTHEFVVIKTDLPQDQLPMDGSEVDEDAVNGIGEVEDIAPGTTKTLDLTLDAGKYVVICNIPGHYQQGMHAALTVTAAGGGAPTTAAETPVAASPTSGAGTGGAVQTPAVQASSTPATGALPSTGSGPSQGDGIALALLAAAGLLLLGGASVLMVTAGRRR